MSEFPHRLAISEVGDPFRPGAAVLNRTLENAWREISPYLDEALDLNGAARECWLVDLDRRAPEICGRGARLAGAAHETERTGFPRRGRHGPPYIRVGKSTCTSGQSLR